ncbi:hypothetical protein QR685DRAFT_574957 [Neurospora intermedia]|uniref:Secreted protein n=1 Tax=Neurospora intermedia TaxID=5142 RepID=A0ABR3D2H6_NEUIN
MVLILQSVSAYLPCLLTSRFLFGTALCLSGDVALRAFQLSAYKKTAQSNVLQFRFWFPWKSGMIRKHTATVYPPKAIYETVISDLSTLQGTGNDPLGKEEH